MNGYLESVKKQFAYYRDLGEKTFSQLSDEKLFYRFNDDSNSIAMIVQHLAGNMISRWTDFLSSDGEKEWRNRDSEFEELLSSREEMLARWNQGWDVFFGTIDKLKESDLDTIIYIRNQGHTVMEAIIRQLAHYPYHIGQIVYLGKMLADNNWKSLSIPKNQSSDYNAGKFSLEKKREHFTDEFLKKKKDQ